MNVVALQGVLAPVPSPIDANDQVRPEWYPAAFERGLAAGLTGFVVLGSNGEAALLDEFESDILLGAARECVPRDRLFIAGVGRESTKATVAACRRAGALGADLVIVRTPGFFKSQMTADAFVRHYRAVADESPVPVLLYNFTAVTGVNLPVAAVTVLAAHPNIVGLKESGGDLAQITGLVAETPDGFAVLAGSASTFYASLCVGASGGVLALANVAPEACRRLYELSRLGRHQEARALQLRLLPVARLLGTYGVAGLKAALCAMGCDVGVPRPPLTPLSSSGLDALKTAIGLLEEVTT